MTIDEQFMKRCFQLARNGRATVSPNPMVGAVVVHKGKIIGEGYHRRYGCPHAEVNAINSVIDQSLLTESTLYVSLEPCTHYGKTPPCSKLIIEKKIPRVVIGSMDPNPLVAGKGISMLREAGVEVTTDILKNDAWSLNKEFFTVQTLGRPYIYLKWAQSSDGFIDGIRSENNPYPVKISNDFSSMVVHKKRAEVDAIMVGTNTVMSDNPHLTTRLWSGNNPVRVILDREGRIPQSYNIYNDSVETLIFTESVETEQQIGKLCRIPVVFNENLFQSVFFILKNRKINSLLIEGGSKVLQSIIKQELWDEAIIEIANSELLCGVKAPSIDGKHIKTHNWGSSYRVYTNLSSDKIL